MDFFEAAGDLIVLYDLEVLPIEMHHLTEILVRGAELTAGAMPRLQVADEPQRLLDRDQPARERRRQAVSAASSRGCSAGSTTP